MKKLLRRLVWSGILMGGILPGRAQTLDPSFAAVEMYAPAEAEHAAQQSDGKIVLVGYFTRVSNSIAGQVARLNADYTPDITFNTNTAALTGTVVATKPLPSGKLMIVGDGPLTLAGVTRQDLLRLNADGTPDASFDAGTASGANGTGQIVCPLPSGKLLVAGNFTAYNGQSRGYLVRLNADGALDNSFTPPALNKPVYRVLLQPDGQMLVAGMFSTPQLMVMRLNPDGTRDASFTSPFAGPSGGFIGAVVLAIHPDGKILVGGLDRFTLASSQTQVGPLVRLLSNGAVDGSFTPASDIFFPFFGSPREYADPLALPGGQVISHGRGGLNDNTLGVQRLNADGSHDATFQASLGQTAYPYVMLRQANGNLLLAGLSLLPPTQRGAALLQPNGAADPTFAPKLQRNGGVGTLALQPDGRVVATGGFSEINGSPRLGLVRFLPDGTLDPSLQHGLTNLSMDVQVQPDGKLLLYAAENALTGESATLTRVLPTGAVDPTFQPASFVKNVSKLDLLPNGSILLQADSSYSSTNRLWRLRPDGSYDASFLFRGGITTFITQAGGNVVVVRSVTSGAQVSRLLPTGALDPSFTPWITNDRFVKITTQPDGRILISTVRQVLRLLANGQPDTSFSPAPAASTGGYPTLLQLQPNGRVLLGEDPYAWRRLLPDGTPDASFVAPSLNGPVMNVAVQPDGKLLAAGYFSSVNGTRRMGLARFVASNVLAVPSARNQLATQAWPVPAHDELRLQLDMTARPADVSLFDLRGRRVLQAQPAASLALDLHQLPAGVYLLRVHYADGEVTRRIVVE